MSKVKVAWKVHDAYTPDEVMHGKAPDLDSKKLDGILVYLVSRWTFLESVDSLQEVIQPIHLHLLLIQVLLLACDSIRLAFLIEALNGINIMACD
jgi:hypothetical protein